MPQTTRPENSVQQIGQALKDHPARWLLPTILVTGLSLAYALLHQPDWEASQALSIRESSAFDDDSPGRFNEAETLKYAQETILELAKSRLVVFAALKEIGPPENCEHPDLWPTAEDVAATRKKVQIISPNGAEFGTTEMFYLVVADPVQQRAIQLTTAICDQLEERFTEFRNQKQTDTTAELTNAVGVAKGELSRATASLGEMEASVGSDLAELRMLNETMAGTSNLHSTLAEMQQELRQADNMRRTNEQLLNLLRAAQKDPSNLVATPNRLLEAQPALRRLKEGLIDAQLGTSRLLGTMSPNHPRVKANLVAEREIRGHLHSELELAVRALRAEQSLTESNVETLTRNITELQDRMGRLAAMRADYGNQVAEVRQLTDNLTRSQRDLANARAALAAGKSASLLTRVDQPRTGPYPAGPGKATIAVAGLAGGLLVGFGIAFLTTSPPTRVVEPVLADAPTPAAAATPRETTTQSAAPAAKLAPAVRPARAARRAPTHGTRNDTTPQRCMSLKEALVRCASDENPWN